MRKAFLASALALGMAGCATSSSPPEVRDLSLGRDTQNRDSVTVERGDTLYGIAWRQGMDFRELARLNDINPPYRLQPGQTLRLAQGAAASSSASGANPGTTATGLSGGVADAGSTGTQNPDWLAPDTQAIERNRQLTSRSLNASSSERQAGGEAPDGGAMAAAGQAGGSDAPGPIYNYESPGADGQLSARDRAESEALASQRATTQTTAENDAPANTPVASRDTQTATQDDARDVAQQEAQARDASTAAASSSSTDAAVTRDGNVQTGNVQAGNDAGTAVAGGADAPQPQQRTYEPVENIPWQWPSDGALIARFGDNADITSGIDIAGQKGQPVKAAGPGIVVYAGDGVRGYGNLILLKHNDRYLSAYAHNDTLRVRENDVVEAGQVIATMGNTDAESVKLHFEVRQDGQPQDPLEFLPAR